MGRRKKNLENIEVNKPEFITTTSTDHLNGDILERYFEADRKPHFMDEVVQPTSEERFDTVVNRTLSEIRELLVVKGKEYRRNNNPYHNFEAGANMTCRIPERVLNGFLLKHLISYNDIINDIEDGKLPTEKIVEEKFNDILVYFLLQKAMILKRIDNGV